MRSYNGTNFVGTINELRKAFQEMDHNQISQYLQIRGADWITWIRNSPTANHMVEVCDRQIGRARSILNALLKTHERSLNDESLRTFLLEVGAIVNSQPMTTEATSKIQSHFLLSLSNLLTMKSEDVKLLPGSFGPEATYCQKHRLSAPCN